MKKPILLKSLQVKLIATKPVANPAAVSGALGGRINTQFAIRLTLTRSAHMLDENDLISF